MISYRDMTFCKSDCTNTSCSRHYGRAVAEKSQSKDVFIRDVIPIATSDFSNVCDDYTTEGETNGSEKTKA